MGLAVAFSNSLHHTAGKSYTTYKGLIMPLICTASDMPGLWHERAAARSDSAPELGSQDYCKRVHYTQNMTISLQLSQTLVSRARRISVNACIARMRSRKYVWLARLHRYFKKISVVVNPPTPPVMNTATCFSYIYTGPRLQRLLLK